MKKKFVKFFIFGFASICGLSILSTNAKAITYQDLYTNYRVKDCEYASYEKINTYIEHPLEDRLIFGKIEKTGLSDEKVEKTIREYGPFGVNKTPANFSKYAYTYTYLTNIEYPYQLMDEADMGENDYITRTIEEFDSISVTFSLETSLKYEYSRKIKAAIKPIDAEVDKNVTLEMKTKIEANRMISRQERISRTYYSRGAGYYRLERRIQLKVYALSMYEIIYSPKVVDNSSWYTKDIYYDYNNGTKMYKYLGTNYVYEQVKNSNNLYQYIFDTSTHTYKYNDKVESGVIYF